MSEIPGSDGKQWYALQVRSRHEKSVNRLLQNRGIESSLPQVAVTREWSDRSKVLRVPLFTGYVFVRADLEQDRIPILTTPGIVRFVSFNGEPAPIPGNQMFWLFQILTEYGQIQPEPDLISGSRVEVVSGPLRGLQGVVWKDSSSSRLSVWFDVIMQGLSVEIDPACLAPAG